MDKHYIIARAGEVLYKSVKRRVSQFMVFAVTFFVGGKAFVGQEIHLSHVGALAASVGLVAYGFQWWANKVLHKHLDYAQSHGANLLKDRKKAYFIDHLDYLWEAVYAPEAATSFSEARRRQAGAEIARIKSAIYEKHRQEKEIARFAFGRCMSHHEAGYPLLDEEAFGAAVEYELRTFHAQNVQVKRLGFSISQLEDLLDGATLTRGDTKIFEHRTDFSMQEIAARVARQRSRWHNFAHQMHQGWARYCQRFWQYNITLAVEANVGSLLSRLHEKYQIGIIDAQHLIWQEEESLAYLQQQLVCIAHQSPSQAQAIIGEIRDETKQIIRKIFSPHRCHARRLVTRMYGYNIFYIINLLMAYDNRYATNKLNHNPVDDMKIVTRCHKELERVARSVHVAAERMKIFQAYADHHDSVLQVYEGEERRAIEVAYYIDHKGLRRKIMSATTSCNQNRQSIEKLCADIANQKSIFTHHLRTLRLHKALAILEFRDIMEHIERLGDL